MSARTAFALPNSQRPTQGPLGIKIALDFTTGDVSSGDLALEQARGQIDYVQSIYIDNSLNAKSLTIVFSGLGFSITVKAGRQGTFPVICGAGPVSWSATSVGAGVSVPVIMTNTLVPYFQWDAV